MSIRTHAAVDEFSLECYVANAQASHKTASLSAHAGKLSLLTESSQQSVHALKKGSVGFFGNMPIPKAVASVASTPAVKMSAIQSSLHGQAPQRLNTRHRQSAHDTQASVALDTVQKELAVQANVVAELNRRLTAAGDRICVLNYNRQQEAAQSATEINALKSKMKVLTEQNTQLNTTVGSHRMDMTRSAEAQFDVHKKLSDRMEAVHKERNDMAARLEEAQEQLTSTAKRLLEVEAQLESATLCTGEALERASVSETLLQDERTAAQKAQLAADVAVSELVDARAHIRSQNELRTDAFEAAVDAVVSAAAALPNTKPVAEEFAPLPVVGVSPVVPNEADSGDDHLPEKVRAAATRIKSTIDTRAIQPPSSCTLNVDDVKAIGNMQHTQVTIDGADARVQACFAFSLAPCPVKGSHCHWDFEHVNVSTTDNNGGAIIGAMMDYVVADFKESFYGLPTFYRPRSEHVVAGVAHQGVVA